MRVVGSMRSFRTWPTGTSGYDWPVVHRSRRVPRPLVAYILHGGGMAHDAERSNRELRLLEAKYRADRVASAVRLDDGVQWQRYLGEMHLRSGRRWAAARTHLAVAVHERYPRGVALAIASVFWPRLQSGRDKRRATWMPEGWNAEADAWLAPLRVTSCTSDSSPVNRDGRRP